MPFWERMIGNKPVRSISYYADPSCFLIPLWLIFVFFYIYIVVTEIIKNQFYYHWILTAMHDLLLPNLDENEMSQGFKIQQGILSSWYVYT